MKAFKTVRRFFLFLIATLCLLQSVEANAQNGGTVETPKECFDSNFHSYWFDLKTVELKVFYQEDNDAFTKEVYPVELVNYETFQNRFSTAWDNHRNPYLFVAGNQEMGNKVWILIDPVDCYVSGYLLPSSYKNSYDQPCPDFRTPYKGAKYKL